MNRPGPRPVVVHVDALDLSAVPVARRAAVASAFVRELQALLAAVPPIERPAAASERPGPVGLGISPGAAPERVGAALARAVHLELTRAPHCVAPASGGVRGGFGGVGTGDETP